MEPQMVVRILANIDGLKEALAQGGSAIQNTTAGMQKMAASFSGDRLVQQAVNMAGAIEKVGGVTTLTAAEMARANAVFERAAEKLTALGNTGAAAQMNAYAEATRNTVPPVTSLRDAVSQLTSKIGSEFNTQFKATLAGFVSGQAVIGAISGAWRTLTGFVSSSVSSFLAAEKAQGQLTAALRASGNATPETIKKFNDLSAAFQRTTVFGDDLITEMQALLTQVGGVMPDQMEGALKAATDLASGLGIDLRQATMLVGKAFEGETGTLKRYGIVIDEAKLKAEGLPAVLDAINSKFGGQASAAIETTAGKMQQLANEWDNVKEAIGAAIITDPLVQAFLSKITESSRQAADALTKESQALTEVEKEALRASEATKKFNLENDDLFTKLVLKGVPGLLAARREVDALRQSYADAQEEASALAKAVAAIPTVSKNINQLPGPLPIPPGTIEGFIAAKKASEEAAKANEAYAKSIQAIRDRLTGGGAIKAAQDYAKAVMENGRVIPLTVNGMEQLVSVLDEALRSTKPLPPEVQKLGVELMKLGVLEPPLTQGMENLWSEIQKLGEVAQDTNAWAKMLAEDGIKTLNTNTKEGGAAFEAMLKGLGMAQKEMPPTEQKTKDLASALDVAAGMVELVGGNSQAASLAVVGLGIAANKLAGNLATAAGSAQAFLSVIGWVMQMKASLDALEAQNRSLTLQLEETNKDIIAQYGSFQIAAEMARRYGIELDTVNTRLMFLSAQGVARGGGPEQRQLSGAESMERFQRQLQNLNEMQDRVTRGVEKYGLAWTDMPNVADRFRIASVTGRDLATTLNALVAAGYDFQTVISRSSDDINEWLANVLEAGVQIPPAMQGIVRALIESGQLTEDNARRMLGLAASSIPSLDDITAAAERYGIALDDLGPKVQQLQIDEAAKQLVDDWNVLSAATEDWGVLFESMGPKVQSLIDDAIRYGAELPAAMKPMLQAFIDAGELVDENGNKLTDLSQLTFAEDLSQMFEQLLAKLDELIVKITDGVAPAFGGIGTSAQSGFKAATDAAAGLKTATDAAVTSYERTKSVFAEGYAEVIGDVDNLGDSLRRLPDEEINIVTTGVEDAKEKIEDLTRTAENVPKQVRIDIDAGDIAAAGYKTIQQLEDIARRAGVIYAEMAKSGKFNSAELERAFKAWQTALNNINPEPLNRAAAAGYQTRDALMAAAKESESLWREMVASGLYTTETLQRAWEAWQDDLAAAGAGGMSRAIREELEGLQRYVESELPEFNELGERIFGVEEQRAIDRIKEIEAQAKAAQESMEGTAASAGVTISGTGEAVAIDMEKQAKGTIREVERMGNEGETAFEAMEISAEEAKRKLLEVEVEIGDIQTMLDESDYGEAFRRAKEDVDALIDAINDIPGGPGGGSSRGMADYAYRTASSDTLGPSVAYRTAPMSSSDSRIVASLDRIGRQLLDQQPDIVIVPMVTGNVDEFESRMAEAMPRRVTRSANLRNAWQRAVNGAAGG